MGGMGSIARSMAIMGYKLLEIGLEVLNNSNRSRRRSKRRRVVIYDNNIGCKTQVIIFSIGQYLN